MTRPIVDMIECKSDAAPPAIVIAQAGALRRGEQKLRASAYRQLQAHMSLGLCNQQRLLVECAADPGVSSWLTAEPLAESGFILNKVEFVDALSLRYGWPLRDIPSSCVCGADLSVDQRQRALLGGTPLSGTMLCVT